MKFQWLIQQARPVLAAELARRLNLPPLLAQCLVNRGINTEAEAVTFLEPRLKNLSDPFTIPGMEAAVERLLKPRSAQEPILILGDYDVDGVTSTALLMEVFRHFGFNVNHYLPHRQDDGYGLNREVVTKCLARFPSKFILAVDCGSSALDCITWLRAQEIDVVVLDHHQTSTPLPPAVALVNPRAAPGATADENLPCMELCSVGLAFKLAHALVKRARERGVPEAAQYDLRPLLDLVALGTIADVVPLVRENRILVTAGLERLSTGKRPGVVALKDVCRCPGRVGAKEVGFLLAPRLNAAGRLQDAEESLRLLMASGMDEARSLAEKLQSRNLERQDIERNIVAQALARVRATFVPDQTCVIVEGDPSWHIGVVGVVASRVQNAFNRPAIILGGDGPHWRGSGRSVAGFDLAAALKECGDLLVRHGGHAMAAGVTIDPTQVETFRSRINDAARRTFNTQRSESVLLLDSEVGLEEINLQSLVLFEMLRPHGQENPIPRFWARGLSHSRPLQRIGQEKQHVKMRVSDGTSVLDAVWWNGGNEQLPVGRFDLAFAPSINEFNGQRSVQLKILDWRPTKEGASTELQF
jgi:single-stranded-DNA-specific exonuclease